MLTKNMYKIACDSGSCKNVAAYSIRAKGFGRGSKFFLCEECLGSLYREIGKILTPKSPDNAIRKSLKKKETAACVN